MWGLCRGFGDRCKGRVNGRASQHVVMLGIVYRCPPFLAVGGTCTAVALAV